MRSKWPAALLVLLCLALPAKAGAQSTSGAISADSSAVTAQPHPIVGTVVLEDGRSYDVLGVRPSRQMQMVRISLPDRSLDISFNRIKRVTAADGRDWTRRILIDGRTLGHDWRQAETSRQAKAGTWDLGADFTILNPKTSGGVAQIPFHAGIYLSPGLEIEPAASIVLAGLPALEIETSELVHLPGGPGQGHVFARFLQGEYFVTPGKSGAPAYGVGLGLEAPSGHSTWGRLEVGYLHIERGPDIAGGNFLMLKFGFNSLKNAR